MLKLAKASEACLMIRVSFIGCLLVELSGINRSRCASRFYVLLDCLNAGVLQEKRCVCLMETVIRHEEE